MPHLLCSLVLGLSCYIMQIMAVRWCPGLLWGHMASSESYRQELWHPSPYVQCLRLSTSLAQELSSVTRFWTSSPCLTVKASHRQRLYTFLSRSLFSELWVADLLPASCSRPLILSLLCSGCHFGVVFFQPPFLSGGMKYLGPLRRLGCLPNIAGTSGQFWLPRLCWVSLVLGIGVTFLKTDGQPRVWSSYFEMLSECLSLTAETVFWGWVVLLGTAEQKGMKDLKHLCFFANAKLSWVFLLFADDILSITQLTSIACHPGLLKKIMKIDDVMVCKSAKHDHFNSAFSEPSTSSLIKSQLIWSKWMTWEKEMLWYLDLPKII